MRLGEGITNPRIIKSYNSFYEKISDKHKDTYDEKIFKHTGITEVFTENVYQMYLEETLNG